MQPDVATPWGQGADRRRGKRCFWLIDDRGAPVSGGGGSRGRRRAPPGLRGATRGRRYHRVQVPPPWKPGRGGRGKLRLKMHDPINRQGTPGLKTNKSAKLFRSPWGLWDRVIAKRKLPWRLSHYCLQLHLSECCWKVNEIFFMFWLLGSASNWWRRFQENTCCRCYQTKVH